MMNEGSTLRLCFVDSIARSTALPGFVIQKAEKESINLNGTCKEKAVFFTCLGDLSKNDHFL